MAGMKRLAKEIKALQAKPPDGVSLHSADDMRCWLVNLQGAPDTLYAGDQYQLQFRFGDDYPMGAPEVTFVGTVPVHHHIYSNVSSGPSSQRIGPNLCRSRARCRQLAASACHRHRDSSTDAMALRARSSHRATSAYPCWRTTGALP